MPSIRYREQVEIAMEGTIHLGIQRLPPDPVGLVLFAHGSGSSRLSSRNNYVAELLAERRIGSLLFDLLTEREDRVYASRFDIDLLSRRLLQATEWVCRQPAPGPLPLGYFGASTGAAAALQAAAGLPGQVAAVVSRGGRPDLAMPYLDRVKAPTLLLVGGLDYQVIELNRQAEQALSCPKQLSIIPGATHLFEEPGTLEQVAQQAGDWFAKYLH
ncbi:dienelactone hydrolase family protein [Marinobacterium arenosum]|uniref:dienelactone hydrolase family protein n=1 Tax=Marinobacterium arenosum TaxID=2862496 RepID=UPI001C937F22|nr:dienelactone hydrolase family protein [Marinobacterium arenosum]MBY4675410.1 dienelactone hydrolase family protein [Marinobacterium arenosum]